MIKFKVKELLEKNKMSRYKLRQYTSLSYERVNDYYFGRVKAIKVEELEELDNEGFEWLDNLKKILSENKGDH